MTESVCAEFIKQFPANDASILHEDRIEFMLSHPTIKKKLDEWIQFGKPESIKEPKDGVQLNDGLKTCNGDGDVEQAPPSYEQAANAEASPAYRFEKNTQYSIQKREEGNVNFQQKKLYDSLQCYNEAIRFAKFSNKNVGTSTISENQDLSLPIALANRSAVYYDLGKDFLNRSLADADLAIAYGYPENMKIKILVRKATIHVRTKRFSSAEECLTQAKLLYFKHCKSTKTPIDILKRISKIEQDIVRELQPSTSATCKRSLSNLSLKSGTEKDDKISCLFKQNPKFEGAAESVMLNYSKDSGRYVTCSNELNVGDIVFQERPFASVLIPEFYEGYCHHCHERLKDGYFFPCVGCTQVKFCSESCSQKAWNQYHQYECLNLELLHSVGIAHLALRVVLVAGLKDVLNAVLSAKARPNDSSNLSVFASGEDKYLRVYSLLDHSLSMYTEDTFQYALTASLLTNFLGTKTNFLDLCKHSDRMKIGGVILRHICQLISNAHAITNIVSDLNADKISLATAEESQAKIASAIYPSVSMMNHSCDPNIEFTFTEGNQIVVKAKTKLKRRDEIFNCYGPYYRRSALEDRQEALRDQYFFNCSCNVCQKEKDDGFSFTDQFRSLKCYKCDGPIIPDERNETFLRECLNCNEFQNIFEQLQISMQTDRMLVLGNTLLEEGKVEEALKTYKTVYEGRKEVLYKFNSELGEVCDTIGKCHAILGEYAEAIPYIKESVAYTGARFGNPSLEYARELKKYNDLVEHKNNKNGKGLLALTKGINKSNSSPRPSTSSSLLLNGN